MPKKRSRTKWFSATFRIAVVAVVLVLIFPLPISSATVPSVNTSPATNIATNSAILNGVLSDPGSAAVVNVYFQYATEAFFTATSGNYSTATPKQNTSATGNFSATISGLVPGTTYHFMAVAEGDGAAYGSDTTFTTLLNPPVVSTQAPTTIKPTSADLNGILNSLGTAISANVSFEYGLTASYGSTSASQILTTSGNFSARINGLAPNTTYHFRARVNGGTSGIAYGNNQTFSTQPAILTGPATNIKTNSATLNGLLLDLESLLPITLFFKYAPEGYFISQNQTYSDTTPPIIMSSSGNFSVTISGLSPGTVYHFKATSANGTLDGQDLTFKTTTMLPVVTTLPASNISRNGATLNGNLVDMGTAIQVGAFFEYGTTINYSQTYVLSPPLTANGTFFTSLSGLDPGTTYHFRAAGLVGIQVIYGIDQSFTTLPIPAVIETRPAINISHNSASLNGNLASPGTALSVNVFFEYWAASGNTSRTSYKNFTASGNYSTDINNLQPGTIYRFRAVADDFTGSLVYGVELSFTTLTIPPQVETRAATAISYTAATLTGALTSAGTASLVDLFFEYGIDEAYGQTTTIQTVSALTTFYANISGLSPGTLYHFRAVAAGGIHGKTYGIDLTFSTSGVIAPQVTTQNASAIGYEVATLNGRLDFLGSASSANVSFEFGPTQTYGKSTPVQFLTTTGNYSSNIGGLQPGAVYHFRTKVTSQIHGTTFGNDLVFTTLNAAAPQVSTLPASNVGYDRAILNGFLDAPGSAGSANVTFEYGTTQGYGSITTIQALSTNSSFSFIVTGLFPNTTYHFRANANSGIHGNAVGNDSTFTTLSSTPPAVTTHSAVNIGFDSATLTGQLISLGTAPSANVSFQYGLTQTYGFTSNTRNLSSNETFSITINSLTPATTYHFMATVDGGVHGKSSGSDLTFTTQNVTAPFVMTSVASNITSSEATLNGILVSLGTAGSANVSFEYGLTAAYGSASGSLLLTSSNTSFSLNVGGLQSATVYHFRARADGGIHGQTFGTDLTLVTMIPPSVTTVAAENITFNSAKISGNLTSFGTASNLQVFFEFGNSTSYGSTTALQAYNFTGGGIFSVEMNSLAANTTYHFRARADGGIHGSAAGLDMTFTTLTPPLVSTTSASGITIDAAVLNGYLNSLGTASTVNVSFEYGQTSSYGSKTSSQNLGVPGAFNAYITGLQPGMTYHFRATADGGINGNFQGNDLVFTTSSTAPVVSTAPATEVGVTEAVLNGNLSSLGTASNVWSYFEYGPTTAYGNVSDNRSMTSPGLFQIKINNISPNTLYHLRAAASDGINPPVKGNVMTFTTSNVTSPAVSTVSVTDISYDRAVLNGKVDTVGSAASVKVAFQYGLTENYGSLSSNQTLSTNTTFSIMVFGLAPATTYHFSAQVDGGIHGTANGTDLAFTTLPVVAPQVSSASASNLRYNGASLNGYLASLGTASSANVSFEYGPTSAYGTSTTGLLISATTSFTQNITGLDPGTLYHFRARTDAGIHGKSLGTDSIFTTLPMTAPEVSTLSASDISFNRATLNGFLNSLGTAESANVSFAYGLTPNFENSTGNLSLSAISSFSQNITGLTPGSTYYFRAIVDGGKHGSNIAMYTTFDTAKFNSVPPAVTTLPAISITPNSGTLSGNLTDLGSANSVTVSFRFGTIPGQGILYGAFTLSNPGLFSFGVSGLLPGKTYYFKTMATTFDEGSASGAELSFTTPYLPPAVDTLAATSITTTSAILNGSLTSPGFGGSSNVSFEYGLTTAYGSISVWQNLNAPGAFSFNLTGLVPGTTYHFRAIAEGGVSSNASGADKSFTTISAVAPVISTNPATNVSFDRATLSAILTSLGTAASANVSFEYGPTAAYGNKTADLLLSAGGSFSQQITDLIPNTGYHFRARADGGIYGLAVGTDQTFTTALAGTTPPAVTTLGYSQVSSFSALLSGNLTSMGSSNSVNVFFEFGTTSSYGSAALAQTLNATGLFSFSVSNLTSGTTYHFRSAASTAGHGSASGTDLTFTTSSAPSGGGGGGGGGGGTSTPTPTPAPSPEIMRASGFLDLSNILSSDGTFKSEVNLLSEDGKALLTIARGAIGVNVDGSSLKSLSINGTNPASLPAPPGNLKMVSGAYNFEPSGAFFSPGVSVTIQYDNGSVQPGTSLGLYYFDAGLRQWISLPNPVTGNLSNSIKAQSTHFTPFAVLAEATESAPVTPTPSPSPSPTRPAVSPSPTQAPSASPSQAVTPTSTPIPGTSPPAASPTRTASVIATAAVPTPTPTPQNPLISNIWILAGAILALLFIGALVYLAVSRRSSKSEGSEILVTGAPGPNQGAAETATTGKSTDSTLYYGNFKLTFQPSVNADQFHEFEGSLRQCSDLQVVSLDETSVELEVSVDKRKPIFLVNVLKALPKVEKVIIRNNQIEVSLQLPPE